MNYSQEWCVENMCHEHWLVRYEVAKRIDKKNALLMSALDEDEKVREIALKNALGLI
jgi:hypothetical protein